VIFALTFAPRGCKTSFNHYRQLRPPEPLRRVLPLRQPVCWLLLPRSAPRGGFREPENPPNVGTKFLSYQPVIGAVSAVPSHLNPIVS
jgi:hypothetical protein